MNVNCLTCYGSGCLSCQSIDNACLSDKYKYRQPSIIRMEPSYGQKIAELPVESKIIQLNCMQDKEGGVHNFQPRYQSKKIIFLKKENKIQKEDIYLYDLCVWCGKIAK